MAKNVPFAVIKEFFKDYEFTDDEIELNQCTTITNIQTFAESHIAILDANTGKKICLPYYDRLLAVYKLINLKWDDKENNGINEK